MKPIILQPDIGWRQIRAQGESTLRNITTGKSVQNKDVLGQSRTRNIGGGLTLTLPKVINLSSKILTMNEINVLSNDHKCCPICQISKEKKLRTVFCVKKLRLSEIFYSDQETNITGKQVRDKSECALCGFQFRIGPLRNPACRINRPTGAKKNKH